MKHFLLTLALLLSSRVVSAQVPITLERPQADPPVPRLRIGGELGGGVAYGANDGGALASFLQIGAQITRPFGVFYQGGLFGFGLGGNADIDPFLTSSHSLMLDITFGNVAQVGVGGGVDVGRLAFCNEDTGACAQRDRDVYGSLSIRAAFLVAFVRDRARWGVPIALHAHTILNDVQAQNALVLTVGFSRY